MPLRIEPGSPRFIDSGDLRALDIKFRYTLSTEAPTATEPLPYIEIFQLSFHAVSAHKTGSAVAQSIIIECRPPSHS